MDLESWLAKVCWGALVRIRPGLAQAVADLAARGEPPDAIAEAARQAGAPADLADIIAGAARHKSGQRPKPR